MIYEEFEIVAPIVRAARFLVSVIRDRTDESGCYWDAVQALEKGLSDLSQTPLAEETPGVHQDHWLDQLILHARG